MSVDLALARRRTSQYPNEASATTPTARKTDGSGALLPGQDAEHDAAHPEH